MAVRITELPNTITSTLDAETPTGMLRLLRQTDAQVHSGWGVYPSLSDRDVTAVMEQVAAVAAPLIQARTALNPISIRTLNT